MIRSTRVRAMFACFGLAACFTTFSGRLVFLHVCNRIEGKHVIKEPVFARRGAIQDINQEVLADNEPIRTVYADGSLIVDPKGVATAERIASIAHILAGPLGLEEK